MALFTSFIFADIVLLHLFLPAFLFKLIVVSCDFRINSLSWSKYFHIGMKQNLL